MEGEEGSTASPAEGRESGAARWMARWPWGWPPPMIWILPETESWRQLSASSQPSSTGLLEPRELPFPPPPPGHCLRSSVPAANHPGPPPWAPVRVLLPQRLSPDVEAVNQQSWWQDLDLEGFLARAMEAQRLRRAREAAAGGPALALSPTAKPAPQGPPCPPHPRPPHSSLMGPLAQPVPSTGTSCRCPFAAPLVTSARPQTEGRTEARSTIRWAAKLGSFQKTEPRAKLFPRRPCTWLHPAGLLPFGFGETRWSSWPRHVALSRQTLSPYTGHRPAPASSSQLPISKRGVSCTAPATGAPGAAVLAHRGRRWAGGKKPYLDAASVGLEAARGVLGGDPALDGTAVDADVLLPQAQVGQAPALGHVDLGVDQVHTAGAGEDGSRRRA